VIELGQVPASQHEMWHVLFELDEQYATGWTLIGAQMVALHAAEHSRTPPRSSEDADVLADARILKPVPGGSQALQRTERKQVRVGTTEGFVPRPNLLGREYPAHDAVLTRPGAVALARRHSQHSAGRHYLKFCSVASRLAY
jgi:hypothetical protein